MATSSVWAMARPVIQGWVLCLDEGEDGRQHVVPLRGLGAHTVQQWIQVPEQRVVRARRVLGIDLDPGTPGVPPLVDYGRAHAAPPADQSILGPHLHALRSRHPVNLAFLSVVEAEKPVDVQAHVGGVVASFSGG